MSPSGAALVAIFCALAALHLYWGAGGLWPGHDQNSLREMVVGASGPMPPAVGPLPGWAAAALVAGLLAAGAAIVAARHSGLMATPLRWLIAAGYVGLILVFAARGLAPYLSAVFEYARDKPFYALNLRLYAPLCLLIATLLVVDFPLRHGASAPRD
ncbi:MAG: DUF3995 domain-containing protein [Hyphomonadaceae bacterium]